MTIADSNALYETSDPQADASGRAGLALGRQWKTARSAFALAADASALGYVRLKDLSTLTYGGGATLGITAAPSLTFDVASTFRQDQSRGLQSLVDAGLVFDQVVTRTLSGSAHAHWQATRKVGARGEFTYQRYSFESDTLVGGAQLTGRADLEMGRQWTLRYELQRQANEDSTFAAGGTSHGPLLLWSPSSKGGFKATLSLGLAFIVPIGVSETTTAPVGGASLNVPIHRHVLSASFSRGVGLAYGLGLTTVSNYALIADTYTVSPRLSLAADGIWGLSTQPSSGLEAFRSLGGGLNVVWRASPSVTMNAGYVLYSFRRVEERMINHSLTLNLVYQQAWQ